MCKGCGMSGGKHKSDCKYLSKSVTTGVRGIEAASLAARKGMLKPVVSAAPRYAGKHRLGAPVKKNLSAFGITH